jgi:hypothetical protein
MPDIRFQSIEDGDLADVWYAMAGQALRYPEHFKPFTDLLLNELLERRGENVNAWLDDRFRDIRSAAEAVQVDLNVRGPSAEESALSTTLQEPL